MPDKSQLLYSSFFPPGTAKPTVDRNKSTHSSDKKPRKPDWLIVVISALILLTLFIAWLVDIPRLLHH